MGEKAKNIIFKYRITWHVLFWIFCYFFYVITYAQWAGSSYRGEIIMNLKLLPIRMIGTYILIYYMIPKYLLKRKYITFVIMVAFHAFLFGLSIWGLIYLFDGVDHDIYEFWHLHKITGSIISNYEIPAIAAVIKFFKIWYLDQQQKSALQIEKRDAELKFLKSQVHPHFLFNTLNNLYALTLRKSDQAPDIVLKLSQLLDYILYTGNQDRVELEKEIQLVEDYIELEKIRYSDKLDIQLKLNGSAYGKKISPLLILPFVENSFKHGVSQEIAESYIHISIDVEDDSLVLLVKNTNHPKNQEDPEYTQGIGLKNVKRRLELLYPEKHTLEILNEKEIFSAKLTLKF